MYYAWLSQEENENTGFTAMVGVSADNEDAAIIAGSAHLRVMTRLEVETLDCRVATPQQEENFLDVGNYITALK